jgi:heptosyltransferase-2
LLPFWAGVPRRRGYVGELRYGLLTEARRLDRDRLPRAVDRFAALGADEGRSCLEASPLPVLRPDADNAVRLAARHRLAPGDGVAFCPGAEYGSAKRWPADHFAAAARALVADGRQVWLLGGPGDVAVCAEIQDRVPRGLVNLAGATSLEAAVDVLSLAAHVVSNDSGLMHVACALGRPVTAIYGASSPSFTPPLSELATVLRLDLPCSPCFERECPLGHRDCLVRLEPGLVVDALVRARV